ncbi:Tetratricopeptide-like helical domain superfamily [Sesbania bispinosa]|nr:Tetratricopeptide-like helical domain superfamily [Sesbania bispinosa]
MFVFISASLRLKILPRSLPFPLSVELPNPTLRCVSSFSSTKPPPPLVQDPQRCIRIFCNARQYQNLAECELALVSALKSCSSLHVSSQGRQIHSLTLKLGLHSNTFIQNSLINMYAKCGSIYDARLLFEACPSLDPVSCNIMVSGYVKAGQLDNARQLFDIMPGKGCVSYTTMIMGLVQNDCFGEALKVFKNMRSDGVVPNDLTMVNVISACSHFGEILNCRMIHALAIKLFVEGLVLVSTNLMHAYCLCSGVGEARRLFDKMPERNLVTWNVMLNGYSKTGLVDMARELFDRIPDKDIISWGTVIDGYIQLDCLREALMMYGTMLRTGLGPNEIMVVNLVSACGRVTAIVEGRQLHGTVVKKGFDSLIDMYAKCGSINTALQFFNQIRDEVSSVSPWNAIICGLASHGHASMCLEVFSDLQRYHIKPNPITFIGVLSACCHAGLVEPGRRIFRSMKSAYNVEPDIKHYGCMVDLLGRAGLLEEAEEMIRSMPMEADVVIWGTLLAASRTHGNVSVGERAAESLAGLAPSHGGGKVLLSNIYADAGRWEDVSLVRRVMQGQRMERMPGCSGVIR